MDAGRLRQGRLRLEHIPGGYEVIGEHGLRRVREGEPGESLVLAEDAIEESETLADYVRRQVEALRAIAPDLQSREYDAGGVRGASETCAVEIRLTHPEGARVVLVQVYVRDRTDAGVVTLTCSADRFREAEREFREALRFLSFHPVTRGEASRGATDRVDPRQT